MSGPKVDVASIREQERRQLEAARQGRKNLADKIKKQIAQIKDSLGGDGDLMMQDESLRPKCETVIKKQEECCKELEKLLKTVQMGNEMLDVEGMTTKMQQIVSQYYNNVKGDHEVLIQSAKSSGKFQELEKNRRLMEQMKRQKIVQLITVEDTPGQPQVDVQGLTEAFRSEIENFMTSNLLLGRHKKAVLMVDQDLQELVKQDLPPQRKEMRIKRMFADFQNMTDHIKEDMKELEVIYEEYVQECFDLSVQVREMNDFNSREELEQTIRETKELAGANMSKEYIRRQIDEVMANHGYDVVRSDMLSETNESVQILYGVDQDTAIDVFVSDENQVTMRVVGIGFDSNISAAEDERLFQQQCAFCSLHPQITKELEMRGVVLHTKKHMAPDKKFNKKLQTRSKTDQQTTSRAKKNLKQTELKTLHKES